MFFYIFSLRLTVMNLIICLLQLLFDSLVVLDSLLVFLLFSDNDTIVCLRVTIGFFGFCGTRVVRKIIIILCFPVMLTGGSLQFGFLLFEFLYLLFLLGYSRINLLDVVFNSFTHVGVNLLLSLLNLRL